MASCPSEPILPDLSVSEDFKSRIDECIEDNMQLIEESLCNLERLLVNLPSSDEGSDPNIQLEYMVENISNYRCIEKLSCYELDMDELGIFFNRLNDYLNSPGGSKEAVLNMLLSLCSHSGFTLPWKTSPNDLRKASLMSLNGVHDGEEQMCEALWTEVRCHLEDYTISCLYQLPVKGESLLVKQKRCDYVKKLHLLTTSRQLCDQYRLLRVCSLNQLINDQLSGEGEAATFLQLVRALEKIARDVIIMIDNDFHLLISGIFRKVSPIFEIISSTYFDKLTDELETIFDDLANDTYGQTENKNSLRRQSEQVMADRLQDKLNKKSMVKDQDQQPVLSKDVVEGIIRLASSLNSIDQHVYSLYLLSCSGLHGIAGQLRSSHEHVRGVLKGTSVTDISILSESIASENDEDLNPLLRATRLHSQAAMMKAPQVIDKGSSQDKPQFLWQESLKRFTIDLCHYIESHINSATDRCINYLTSEGVVQEMKLCPVQRGGMMEYPVAVYKAVSEFISALQHVLPLAQAAGSLLQLQQTFISAVISCSKKLLDCLTKMIDQRLYLGEGYRNTLLVISSVALLRNTLYQCDSLLSKDTDKHNTFVLVYHQYCQAVDNLSQQYVTAEVSLINNTLLHDADSFNWSDSKEFFEAWSYHMQLIRLELWSICPPSNATSMFSDILRQTLDTLTLRYLAEFPTHRRLDQYRIDVTIILHVVYELMFSVSSTSAHLLDIQSAGLEQPYLAIHSCCCKLLAQMAIATCPLDELYKVFKKGYQKKRRFRYHDEDQSGYYSHWMSWIKPSILPRNVISVNDMQTTTALYIQLKLMSSQPETSWASLLQILTMKDFTLPIMILAQPNLSTGDLKFKNEKDKHLRCDLIFCEGECSRKCRVNLFEPFLNVISKIDKASGLFEVLLPVINRNNHWPLFDSSRFYQVFPNNMPGWFPVIDEMIRSFISPAILSAVLAADKEFHRLNVPRLNVTSFSSSLPCGCDVDFDVEREKNCGRDITPMVIEQLLKNVSEAVACVPLSICTLLEKLGEEYQSLTQPSGNSSNHSYTIQDKLILQLLALVVQRCLSDRQYLELLVNGEIDEPILKILGETGFCLYSILSPGDDVLALEFSPLQREFVSNFTSLGHQAKAAMLDQVKHRRGPWAGNLDKDIVVEKFVEHSMAVSVNEILETPKGYKYLQAIYNLLTNNLNWIYSSLDIHEVENVQGDVIHSQFTPDVSDNRDSTHTSQRNPLTLYNTLAGYKINFEAYRNHVRDWTSLLQSDLGLTDLSLSTMLLQRHDFLDGAYLEPAEKKKVDTLKSKFSTKVD